ncbi:MAG: mechanosensitive ion channel family protein [Oscillospiraceae bacterium]|nr:mechanosensitive ion channel family protein [Oscillospiraceae bacterium]
MDFAAILSLPLVSGAITLIVCLIVVNLVLSIVEKAIDKLGIEETMLKFVRSILKVAVYTIAILIVASSFGFDVTSLVALVSVLTAAIALAAQNVLANFFGGVLLLFSHPIRVGEYVSTAAGEGVVQEVGILNTVLKTVDNQVVTVPNGTVVAGTIKNFSRDEFRRVDVDFAVSYDADIDHVYAVMLKVMEAHPLVLSEPAEPFARITAYTDSSVTYTARAWCKSGDYWTVRFDLLEGIKKAFDKTGIQIPYNHINVHMIQGK